MSERRRHELLKELFEKASPLDERGRVQLLMRVSEKNALLARELEALLKAGKNAPTVAERSALSGPVPKRIGRYEILRELGEGGMGVVYEAVQESPKRVVALKFARHLTPRGIERFRLEADSLGRLSHPHIAKVFEASQVELGGLTQPYFAMELIEGTPIGEAARERDLREQALLLAKTARAVEHAHERGVLHRDLKPENVLVTPEGEPKVLDFGIAKILGAEGDEGRTESGVILGSPHFMSPEQALGTAPESTTRMDVYSLGMLGYSVFSGKVPTAEYESRGEILDAVISQREWPLASFYNPKLRGDLDAIVSKATRKSPKERYASARELAEDFERYLSGEPVSARVPTRWYRARKFALRNKLLVGSLTVVLCALLFGSAFATWGYFQSQENLYELGQSEGKLRLEVAESHLSRARIAGQRGAWKEALRAYDLAQEAGHPEAESIALEKARSLISLERLEEAEALLSALEGSEAKLLLGDIALTRGRENEGERLVEAALEEGLPEGEALYARALLSDTDTEAEALLSECLRVSPYHHQAHALRLALRILLGRRNEARHELASFRTLFPEDLGVPLLEALLYGSAGEEERSSAALEEAGDLGEQKLDAMRGAFSFVRRISSSGEKQNPVLLAGQLVALFAQSKGSFSVVAPKLRCFRLCFGEMKAALAASPLSLLRGTAQRDFARRSAKAASHASFACLNFLAGTILRKYAVTPSERREAADLLHKAATSTSLFGDIVKHATFWSAYQNAAVYLEKDSTEELREVARRRVTEAAQAFLLRGPSEGWQLREACVAASNVGNQELAERVGRVWLRGSPKNHHAWKAMAYVHHALGEHHRVLVALGKVETFGGRLGKREETMRTLSAKRVGEVLGKK